MVCAIKAVRDGMEETSSYIAIKAMPKVLKIEDQLKPLVSILIPCYNAAPFISETLDSIIAQTYSNWECIIVDDQSTDNSLEIIKGYEEKYTGKIITFKNCRKGACAARNMALEISKGEFIQYLDADDLLSSKKIEVQVKALKRNQEKMAVCNTWHFFSTTLEAYNTDDSFIFSTENPAELFTNLWGANGVSNFIQTSAWLTPRKMINKFGNWNESLLKDQDGEFFARLALNSKGIIYTPGVKNYYRKHVTGKNIASQLKRDYLISNLKATDLKRKYLFSINHSNEAFRAIATQYKLVAIEAFPNYPKLYKEALKKCQELGGSDYIPVLGGKLIEFTKFFFGWRLAKWVSWYGHRNLLWATLFPKN